MSDLESGREFDLEASLKPDRPKGLPRFLQLDRLINRPLATVIVRAVLKTGLRPNHLTVAAFVISAAGAGAFLGGTRRSFILAAVLIYAGTVLDGADGMLARARGQCSAFGSHLDLFLDRIIDFSIFAGIALGASRHFQAPHLLALGLLATGLYQLQIILFYLTKSYLKSEERGDTGEARALLYWLVLIFAVTSRLDIFIYLLLAETVVLNTFRLGYFISLSNR